MGPVKEIAELKAKREKLEQLLEQKGISEAREICIRQQIIAIGNEITQVWPPMLTKVESGWNYDAIAVAFTGVGMMSTAWWVIYPRYCVWRHDKYPYTPSQIKFRQTYFDPRFPEPVKPSAHRLPRQLFQGFLALSAVENLVMWWRKKPPRESSVPLSLIERWWRNRKPPPPPS